MGSSVYVVEFRSFSWWDGVWGIYRKVKQGVGMGENLFCDGQKIVNGNYADGWMRSFRGYPKMSPAILEMLRRFTKKKQYAKMLIFFIGKMDYDEDYSYFLIREFVRGYV